MPTRDVLLANDPWLNADTDWDMSRKKGFRASIIVWGMPRYASALEVRGKLADVGLVGFASESVVWEGDHIRLILAPRDSKGLNNEIVSHISACLRKIGCRCVLDENRRVANQKLQCVESLSTDVDSDEPIDIMSVDVVQWVGGYKKYKGLKGRE